MTDEDALVAYAKDHPELEFEAGPSARLHNKGYYSAKDRKMVYPNDTKDENHVQKEQANYKVLLGFRTEFILSKDGNFLNEIDPEGATENGIVNGASFNYGEDGSSHKNLDMDTPAVWDPKFRKNEIDSPKLGSQIIEKDVNGEEPRYSAPKNNSNQNGYYSSSGNYSLDKKYSAKELVDREVEEFKNKIKEKEK